MSIILKKFSKFNKKKRSKVYKTEATLGSCIKDTIECPIKLEWIISAERLMAMKDAKMKCLRSDKYDAFNIYGVKYHLSIYPNGNNKQRQGQTWIFLEIEYEKEETEVDANYCLAVDTNNHFKVIKHIYKENIHAFGLSWCTFKELFDPKRKFIVDGMLTIRVEGVLKVTKMLKEDDSWDARDFAVCLWNRDATKDFTIIVENAEIKVHKIVLSTRSRVFEAMFESNLKEAKENHMFITDFSYEIVEAAIKLCYHRNLKPAFLSIDDKMQLLLFFDKYDIQHCKDFVETSLISEISSLNVCNIANFALYINSTILQVHCAQYLRNCLKISKPIYDFDSLNKEFAMNILKNSFCHISKTT